MPRTASMSRPIGIRIFIFIFTFRPDPGIHQDLTRSSTSSSANPGAVPWPSAISPVAYVPASPASFVFPGSSATCVTAAPAPCVRRSSSASQLLLRSAHGTRRVLRRACCWSPGHYRSPSAPSPPSWLKPLTTAVARNLLIPVAYAPVIIG